MAFSTAADIEEDAIGLAATRRHLKKRCLDSAPLPSETWSSAEHDRCDAYVRKWAALPCQQRCAWEELVCHLGDNPTSEKGWTCWSGVSSAIPTIRRSGGIMAVPAAGRHMTLRELYISMGFPCVPFLADVAKVPVYSLDLSHYSHQKQALGNSFHVAQAGVFVMCSLALAALKEQQQ